MDDILRDKDRVEYEKVFSNFEKGLSSLNRRSSR